MIENVLMKLNRNIRLFISKKKELWREKNWTHLHTGIKRIALSATTNKYFLYMLNFIIGKYCWSPKKNSNDDDDTLIVSQSHVNEDGQKEVNYTCIESSCKLRVYLRSLHTCAWIKWSWKASSAHTHTRVALLFEVGLNVAPEAVLKVDEFLRL